MNKSITVIILVVFLASGCASNKDFSHSQNVPRISAATSDKPSDHHSAPVGTSTIDITSSDKPSDYRIGTGDVLEITVFGEETLSRPGLVVRPDGKISFPLVGDIQAGGHTSGEVKEQLEKSLQEYIPAAVAAVGVAQLASLQYYVVGKVNKPGVFSTSKPITVLQALALAGGLTAFAAENKIMIMRDFGTQASKIPFNYRKIKNGENMEQNILLQRGDVVLVP